jgi:hypothetical protein
MSTLHQTAPVILHLPTVGILVAQPPQVIPANPTPNSPTVPLIHLCHPLQVSPGLLLQMGLSLTVWQPLELGIAFVRDAKRSNLVEQASTRETLT